MRHVTDATEVITGSGRRPGIVRPCREFRSPKDLSSRPGVDSISLAERLHRDARGSHRCKEHGLARLDEPLMGRLVGTLPLSVVIDDQDPARTEPVIQVVQLV